METECRGGKVTDTHGKHYPAAHICFKKEILFHVRMRWVTLWHDQIWWRWLLSHASHRKSYTNINHIASSAAPRAHRSQKRKMHQFFGARSSSGDTRLQSAPKMIFTVVVHFIFILYECNANSYWSSMSDKFGFVGRFILPNNIFNCIQNMRAQTHTASVALRCSLFQQISQSKSYLNSMNVKFVR